MRKLKKGEVCQSCRAVGCGSVHDSGAEVGAGDSVEGVGVAGASYVLDGFTGVMEAEGDAAHEGGLTAAGAALEEEDSLCGVGWQELIVQGIKT